MDNFSSPQATATGVNQPAPPLHWSDCVTTLALLLTFLLLSVLPTLLER